MWRRRIPRSQRRVLHAVAAAHSAGAEWVSGYALFEAIALAGAEGRGAVGNHGRVFAALRRLAARGLLDVRIERERGLQRAAYRLTPRGRAALVAHQVAV